MRTTTTASISMMLLTAASLFLLAFMDVSHGFMVAPPFHVSPMTRSKNPAAAGGAGAGAGQCIKPYSVGIPTPGSPLFQTFGGDVGSDGRPDTNSKIVSEGGGRGVGGGVNASNQGPGLRSLSFGGSTGDEVSGEFENGWQCDLLKQMAFFSNREDLNSLYLTFLSFFNSSNQTGPHLVVGRVSLNMAWLTM
jgi:hypothetical protein